MTNKPEVVAWLHSIRQDSDVITSRVRNVWGAPLGSMGAYTVALIRLSDHEAERAADKARIAELGEELAYALADFDAWASHENNHPHEHLVAWSERARAALAKTRGEA